jgi:hypothetical protein
VSFQEITCPACRCRLSLAESAPRIFSCPRCLARIDLLAEGSTTSTVDRAAERDGRAGTIALCILGALLAGGFAIIACSPRIARRPERAVVGVLLLSLFACVGLLSIRAVFGDTRGVRTATAALSTGCLVALSTAVAIALIVIGVAALILSICGGFYKGL